jgi:hypothetical protein
MKGVEGAYALMILLVVWLKKRISAAASCVELQMKSRRAGVCLIMLVLEMKKSKMAGATLREMALWMDSMGGAGAILAGL